MSAAIAYVRVSSKAQRYETQRDAIEREARARGDGIAEWRAEKRSAKTMDRPELTRLREDVRVGRVHKVYVFKLDRLCRTGVADTFAVVSELRRGGCTLVAVADNLTIRPEADDVTSEVLVFALGLAAKLERAAINERIAATRERLATEGKPWGRRPRMTPEEVARAAAMRAEGRSIRSIAMGIGHPRATVAAALKRAAPSQLDAPAVVHERASKSGLPEG
jgi:DNA invertase Pin-like site-specific DNA recombinase